MKKPKGTASSAVVTNNVPLEVDDKTTTAENNADTEALATAQAEVKTATEAKNKAEAELTDANNALEAEKADKAKVQKALADSEAKNKADAETHAKAEQAFNKAIADMKATKVVTATNTPDKSEEKISALIHSVKNSADGEVAFNLCDMQRLLPTGVELGNTLWSLVSKEKITHSINIVRQQVQSNGKPMPFAQIDHCTANDKVVNLKEYTQELGNYFLTFPLCNRRLRRDDFNDNYIMSSLEEDVLFGVDNEILNGTGMFGTERRGLRGILTADEVANGGTLVLPDGTTLGRAIAQVRLGDRQRCAIILRPTDWWEMHEDGKNLPGVTITVNLSGVEEMRYGGIRVIESNALPEEYYALVGNFRRYRAGFNEQAVFSRDTSVGFKTDQTWFKAQMELAGGSDSIVKEFNGIKNASFVAIAAPVSAP